MDLLSEAARVCGSRRETLSEEGRVVVWTDGAAKGKGGEAVAAGGVFYAAGDRRNRAVGVRGE